MDCHECDGTGNAYGTDPEPCTYCDGTGKRFDAHAWPGGYPLAYYPLGTHGDIDGTVLCPDCAKREWTEADADDKPRFHSEIEEEVHDTIYCDACSQPFIFQNWCHFCQDSVDVDENTPHVCKPLKWSVTYQHNATIPARVDRHATREQARDNARRYKQAGYAVAKVAPITPPIMPYS